MLYDIKEVTEEHHEEEESKDPRSGATSKMTRNDVSMND